MNTLNIYTPIWQKYRPVILNKMKLALEEIQEYPMYKHEFEFIGGKKASGYGFNLEIRNGMVVNNITSIAVARGLFAVLKSSDSAKAMMQGNHFKINLTADYKLKIQTIVAKVVVEPTETVAAE